MAKFTPSFGNLSGKVGGLVFSHNSYGTYVKRLTVPANPATIPQALRRAQMSAAADAFAHLSDGNRLKWEAFASGQAPALSAMGWFSRINTRLYQYDKVTSTEPPSAYMGVDIQSCGLSITPPTLHLSFTPNPLPANVHLFVMATPPVSPGVKYYAHLMRLVWMGDSATTSPANITAGYVAVFGALPLVLGYKVYAQCYAMDYSPAAVAYASAPVVSSSSPT